MVITSPPKARISGPYSRSGSTTIISWSVFSATKPISCFAIMDLPLPDTPVYKPWPLSIASRLQMMRLWDTALTP